MEPGELSYSAGVNGRREGRVGTNLATLRKLNRVTPHSQGTTPMRDRLERTRGAVWGRSRHLVSSATRTVRGPAAGVCEGAGISYRVAVSSGYEPDTVRCRQLRECEHVMRNKKTRAAEKKG